jgi:hypothetical protein
MTATKNLGIWMDHANAHIIEFTTDFSGAKTVSSKFTHAVKEESLGKSEALMHNKEQHEESEYYKKLGEIISGYTDVVLFGPTEAKAELHNVLSADHRFAKIHIATRPADKMTKQQMHEFVTSYFSNR